MFHNIYTTGEKFGVIKFFTFLKEIYIMWYSTSQTFGILVALYNKVLFVK